MADAAPLLGEGEQSDDGWIDLRSIKVFIDGTLGSQVRRCSSPMQTRITAGS